MADIVPFTPSPTSNFEFQPTLDGQAYNVIITWSLFGLRYYINLLTLQNQLIFSVPLIGSPADSDISLTEGYFDTEIIYRAPTNQFEII